MISYGITDRYMGSNTGVGLSAMKSAREGRNLTDLFKSLVNEALRVFFNMVGLLLLKIAYSD